MPFSGYSISSVCSITSGHNGLKEMHDPNLTSIVHSIGLSTRGNPPPDIICPKHYCSSQCGVGSSSPASPILYRVQPTAKHPGIGALTGLTSTVQSSLARLLESVMVQISSSSLPRLCPWDNGPGEHTDPQRPRVIYYLGSWGRGLRAKQPRSRVGGMIVADLTQCCVAS